MHALQNTLPKALQTTLLVPFRKCDCFFKMKHHKALAACSCPPLSKPLYSELPKPSVFTNVVAPSTVKWRDNTHSRARIQLGAPAWKPKLGGSPCNSDWRCDSSQVTWLAVLQTARRVARHQQSRRSWRDNRDNSKQKPQILAQLLDIPMALPNFWKRPAVWSLDRRNILTWWQSLQQDVLTTRLPSWYTHCNQVGTNQTCLT